MIHDGSELDLLWSRASRGIAVVLSLVVTLSGQVFGDGIFDSQKIVESKLKRVHDLGEMAADGNWDRINSDLSLYRYWRPAYLNAGKLWSISSGHYQLNFGGMNENG